jgi:flagellar hook-associated protein 3 FlgL
MSLRFQQVQLKIEMSQLTSEVATGQVSDEGERVGGDFRQLASIEHSLTQLESYRTIASEAQQMAGTLQTMLGGVQDEVQSLATSLIGLDSNTLPIMRETLGTEAAERLETIIGTLNTQAAGRSYLSGTATDTPPLADASTLMNALRGVVSGQTTAAGIISELDVWFDAPGGGFDTIMYQGGNQDLAALRFGDAETAQISLRADDATFREVLKNTAIAALATDPAAGVPVGIQADLQRHAGEALYTVNDGLTGIRANIGSLEARIDETATRNAAEASSLAQARNALLEADPYETASRLEEVQYQLEAVYALTARSAQLSLLEYLA